MSLYSELPGNVTKPSLTLPINTHRLLEGVLYSLSPKHLGRKRWGWAAADSLKHFTKEPLQHSLWTALGLDEAYARGQRKPFCFHLCRGPFIFNTTAFWSRVWYFGWIVLDTATYSAGSKCVSGGTEVWVTQHSTQSESHCSFAIDHSYFAVGLIFLFALLCLKYILFSEDIHTY